MKRNGKMESVVIDSIFLDESLEVRWYKPETFSPLYKHQLCIMQDGNDYFQMGRIATLSDQLHSEERIQNTVFAGIHYRDRYDRIDKYYPTGKKHEAYLQFLLHEVLPLLEDDLPTLHMGATRTLMGDSLAGTFALLAAMRFPHTFGSVVMQSPLVDDTVMQEVKDARQLDSLSIYHTIGTKETAVPTSFKKEMDFVVPNRSLQAHFQSQAVDYTYRELEDAEHTWKYWQRDMKQVLLDVFG
ncbi:Enterochelin esterase [Terribacillus aidingensis]|uniref:Enterochelin esterase n=1 Tax=Terribacillus aidingensis TaxID=586416 RepID=A0A285NYG4_9BACI|nr:alpha/beta hydrolase-fold protein [Terribacillus aidingensis]SNZ14248.1 Enterochelin esterase [Terribacillus aidingensis]